jgi:hypothetical protein
MEARVVGNFMFGMELSGVSSHGWWANATFFCSRPDGVLPLKTGWTAKIVLGRYRNTFRVPLPAKEEINRP